MKKLIATLTLAVLATSAQADCKATLAKWKSQDSMVHSFDMTSKETVIWVKNIRNFKAIDMAFYGFDDFAAKKLETKNGCQNVKFEEAYTDLGLPRFN